MQGAIIPSSDTGILVQGWHRGVLRKVNPSSWSDCDFCHRQFGSGSALTPTSLAEFVMSGWFQHEDIAVWNLNLGCGNEYLHLSVFFRRVWWEGLWIKSHWPALPCPGFEETQGEQNGSVGAGKFCCWSSPRVPERATRGGVGGWKDIDTEARTGFES